MPNGECVRIRTTRTRPSGAARTSLTSTRRSRAPRWTARNIGTGSSKKMRRLEFRNRRPTRGLTGRGSSGFTLIELMVVISLLVILASMGLVQYRHSIVRSKEAVLKEDLFRIRDAIDQYYADKNQYPSTLDALVSDGYIRTVPKDPFTQSES